MILTKLLAQNEKIFSRKPAFVMRMGYRTVSLTYGDLALLARTTACLLEKESVGKGGTVLLLAPNSPYWITLFWGVVLRGAILVPLNIQSTPEFVKRIADVTGARLLFSYPHFLRSIGPEHWLRRDLKIYDVEILPELVEGVACADRESVAAREDDLVEIMYTSGTTGDPKGVMLSHKNLSSNVEAVSQIIPVSSRDVFLSILPLSHIYEQIVDFLIPFWRGATVVQAHSPAAIRALLREYRVTKMAAVPEFLRIVMARIEAAAEEKGRRGLFEGMRALSRKIGMKPIQRLFFRQVHRTFGGRLTTISSGGAPLDPELEQKWDALGVYLLQGYGLTETSPVVSTNTYRTRRLGSVGKPIPGVEVKIAPDGEILVRGPNVFQGYSKDEEKTRNAFTPDGWFKSDDMGEIDQDGFLYIRGRKKYMILGEGGQNVYPEDIESELNRVPGVKDSTVVGLSRPGGRVEIHAVLLLAEGGDSAIAEKIVAEANTHLASYQQIATWSIWSEEDFPRSLTRKVKKEEVMRWLKEREAGREVRQKGVRPVSPLVQILSEITSTGAERIHPDTNIFSELSLDSLLRVELVARIEEKFGVRIDETEITPSTTVADLEAKTKTAEPVGERPRLRRWPRARWAAGIRTLVQEAIIFPLSFVFVELRVENQHHLRGVKLPLVFMPNHISYLDSLVLLRAIPRTIRSEIAFAAAQDVVYGEYKPMAWLLELLFNVFPFPRREHEDIRSGLEHMGEILDRGWSVVVYPEGQLSSTGDLLPLKRGAGLVGVEMDAFIVPVKILGTNAIVPYAKIFPRKRGVVRVKFGTPVKFSRRDSYVAVTERIQAALESL